MITLELFADAKKKTDKRNVSFDKGPTARKIAQQSFSEALLNDQL